jgi:predicted MPP superfamily phosphohydrolase
MKKIKIRWIVWSVLAVALIALVLWTAWANTALMVSEYTVSDGEIPAAFDGFRIAQISDLHNAEFGEGNEELLSQLSFTEPDIIVITGDLVDANRLDAEVGISFCREAVQIAPVYYVTGNHEAGLSSRRSLLSSMEEVGVTVLRNNVVSITREGETVTLLGVHDPNYTRGMVMANVLLKLTKELEGYSILLSHRPELFEEYVASGVDLVFSGHAHGGQFRLPFIGGVYAPSQGWFPTYDGGLYTEGDTTMVVSRGLGNSRFPFRLNNRPEIVVVELRSSM